jgi:hypothetical protein
VSNPRDPAKSVAQLKLNSDYNVKQKLHEIIFSAAEDFKSSILSGNFSYGSGLSGNSLPPFSPRLPSYNSGNHLQLPPLSRSNASYNWSLQQAATEPTVYDTYSSRSQRPSATAPLSAPTSSLYSEYLKFRFSLFFASDQ